METGEKDRNMNESAVPPMAIAGGSAFARLFPSLRQAEPPPSPQRLRRTRGWTSRRDQRHAECRSVRSQCPLQHKFQSRTHSGLEKNGTSPITWYWPIFRSTKSEPAASQDDPAEIERNQSWKFLQFLENFSGVYPTGGRGQTKCCQNIGNHGSPTRSHRVAVSRSDLFGVRPPNAFGAPHREFYKYLNMNYLQNNRLLGGSESVKAIKRVPRGSKHETDCRNSRYATGFGANSCYFVPKNIHPKSKPQHLCKIKPGRQD